MKKSALGKVREKGCPNKERNSEFLTGRTVDAIYRKDLKDNIDRINEMPDRSNKRKDKIYRKIKIKYE